MEFERRKHESRSIQRGDQTVLLKNVRNKMWIRIYDADLVDLFAGRFEGWMYDGMQFQSFFEIPNGDITVSGHPRPVQHS